MSEADYEAIQTTNHLFSSAANSRILMRSFAESDAGNVVIEDPDAFLDGE
jgi:PHD/YefM family antitoxin component YafN of YafNO toxin-antitoxin module